MKEKSWEYVGKTVDEAIETAIEELGLERDDVHVEVLEEPQKGFLGLGGKEAHIKVEVIGEWEVVGEKKGSVSIRSEEEGLTTDTGNKKRVSVPVKMTNDILKIIGIEAMVEAKENEEAIIIDVWGDDVAILIGKGGNTLEALQYLVNVCCRRKDLLNKRIIVDIEGYRKRRKSRIEKQAEQLANKAISRGESVELPPMSASERKIVHMALRSIDGVVTESIGDEPERRVIIHPEEESST